MCVFHYLPLHLSQMGIKLGGRPAQCPVTESVSDRIVRLPFFTGMTDSEIDTLIAAIKTISIPFGKPSPHISVRREKPRVSSGKQPTRELTCSARNRLEG
jgi:hypothetical protein